VVGRDLDELATRLGAVADASDLSDVAEAAALPGVFSGRGGGRESGTVVVFPGSVPAWAGMGAELHATFPVFASAFDEVCAVADELLGVSLRDAVLARDPDALGDAGDAGDSGAPVAAQAALVAVGVALFAQLRAWRLTVDHVIGHSVGELVAAHVAGLLSLPDALRLVAEVGTGADDRASVVLSPGAEAVVSPEHWVNRLRRPVPFTDAVAQVRAAGATRFLVAGPEDAVAGIAGADLVVGMLRRDLPEAETVLSATAGLFVTGAEIDWSAVLAVTATVPADLPTYAFQRRPYWLGVHAEAPTTRPE
jgi:acyl transferase domain-containing protein